MCVTYIGLGRIGLPQALVTAEAGYKTYGVEIKHDLLQQIETGTPFFEEPSLKRLLERNIFKNFFRITDTQHSINLKD